MKTLTTLLLGFLCFASEGQVLIYKYKNTGTGTGGGSTQVQSQSGFAVLDLMDSSNLAIVSVDAVKKQFSVDYPDSWNSVVVNGSGGRQYTVLFEVSSSADASGNPLADSTTVKGLNSLTEIGDTEKWMVPKTFQTFGRKIRVTDAGDPQFVEFTGSLTLDSKNTVAANKAAMIFDDSVTLITDQLVAKGYTEIQ